MKHLECWVQKQSISLEIQRFIVLSVQRTYHRTYHCIYVNAIPFVTPSPLWRNYVYNSSIVEGPVSLWEGRIIRPPPITFISLALR